MGERQRGKDTRKQNSGAGYRQQSNAGVVLVRHGRSPPFWLPLPIFHCEALRPFLALYGRARELPESFYAPLEMDSGAARLPYFRVYAILSVFRPCGITK